MNKAKLAFIIAVIYVAAGTVFGLYYHQSFHEFPTLVFYFFSPVCLMPAFLSAGEKTDYILLAFIQIASCLLIWLLLLLTMWAGSAIFRKSRSILKDS